MGTLFLWLGDWNPVSRVWGLGPCFLGLGPCFLFGLGLGATVLWPKAWGLFHPPPEARAPVSQAWSPGPYLLGLRTEPCFVLRQGPGALCLRPEDGDPFLSEA